MHSKESAENLYLCDRTKKRETMMKYPIGIQSFAQLREDNYVYVDKTALIYQLVSLRSRCR